MTALGVDIGGSGVRVLADGGLRFDERLPAGEGDALSSLRAALDGVRSQAPTQPSSVAVVCGGHISESGDITHWPNRTEWVGANLRALVRDALGADPVFEDDCSAAALAESHNALESPLVYIGLGTGVGAGLVIEGTLMRGAHGQAMELGHMPVPSASERCNCGEVGCVQAIAGGRALRAALEQQGVGTDLGALERALKAGEPWAEALAGRVTQALNEALSTLVRLIDPACVVIGGGVVMASPTLFQAIARSAEAIVPIRPAVHGADSSLRGALLLAQSNQ